MIHPSCGEVLATIRTGFEDQIVPHLGDGEARSAAATIGHLLRHVALRIDSEGQILFDDIARLRRLLADIAAWFEHIGEGDAAELRSAIAQELAPDEYPSLERTGQLALSLRGALVAAQERLHALAASCRGEPQYQALRQAIRDYIAAQLDDEVRLIVPAFLGKGPRR